MKLRKVNREGSPESPDYVFFCPGCKYGHGVWIAPNKNPLTGASWTFNEDLERPTFSPSILLEGKTRRCHLFVRDGFIEFLKDSHHKLAGQTVLMPNF